MIPETQLDRIDPELICKCIHGGLQGHGGLRTAWRTKSRAGACVRVDRGDLRPHVRARIQLLGRASKRSGHGAISSHIGVSLVIDCGERAVTASGDSNLLKTLGTFSGGLTFLRPGQEETN